MRLLGVLSQVALNIDVGAIEIAYGSGGKHISARRSAIISSTFRLYIGKFVTYEVKRKDGIMSAVNVLLIDDEKDEKMIRRLIKHKHQNVWMPVLKQAVHMFNTDDVIEVFQTCLATHSSYGEQSSIMTIAPNEVLEFFKKDSLLRLYLSKKDRFDFYATFIKENKLISSEMRTEIVDAIHSTREIPAEILLEWMSPDLLESWPELREALTIPLRIAVYMKILHNNQILSDIFVDEILRTLYQTNKKDIEAFLIRVPLITLRTFLQSHSKISLDIRLKLYCRILNEEIISDLQVIDCVADILSSATIAMSTWFAQSIRINILLENERLRFLLPVDVRLSVFTRALLEWHKLGDVARITQAIEMWEDEITLIAYQGSPETVLALARAVPRSSIIIWRELRDALAPEDHLRLCLAMWKANAPTPANAELHNEIIDILQILPADSSSWKTVPYEFLYEQRSFRKYLPKREHSIYILRRISDDIQPNEFEELINELQAALPLAIDEELWQQIPMYILILDPIRASAPKVLLVRRIAEEIQRKGANEYITLLVEAIKNVNDSEYNDLWKILPLGIKRLEPILWMLPIVERARAVCSLIEDTDYAHWQHIWDTLTQEIRLLCIYYFAKKDACEKLVDLAEKEVDPIVRAGLILLRAKNNIISRKNQAFEEAHTLLENYVVDQAWLTDAALLLDGLLPHCPPQLVKYCEARAWPTPQDKEQQASFASRAFCPRARSECSLQTDIHIPLYHIDTSVDSTARGQMLRGAHLYANCDQEWHNWSLMELLVSVGIHSVLNDLPVDEYVRKFSGWVNRLNEIRERLRCSICSDTMIPNRRYAKFLARFNMTVASCPHGVGHDQNIYINQCWACVSIIDSRESLVLREKYYLCTSCGSGPQYSPTYAQGSVCPKCESTEMNLPPSGRDVLCCKKCNHILHLPIKQKMTGPGSSRQYRPTNYEDR